MEYIYGQVSKVISLLIELMQYYVPWTKPGYIKQTYRAFFVSYWPDHLLLSANALSHYRWVISLSTIAITLAFNLPWNNGFIITSLVTFCITDVLDGTVANAKGTNSQKGGFLDQKADKISIHPLLIFLTLSNWWALVLEIGMIILDTMSYRTKRAKLIAYHAMLRKKGITENSPQARELAAEFNSNANDYGKNKMGFQFAAAIFFLAQWYGVGSILLLVAIHQAIMSLKHQTKK